MDREILFRGKRVDNGEWIEGNYLDVYTSNGLASLIMNKRFDEEKRCITNHAVIEKSTRGQYTGLTDKNGKKIFEGDIVRHYNNPSRPEEFDVGVIYYDENYCAWYRTTSKYDRNLSICKSCVYEVIGNIHDNPELVGGKTND